MNSNSFAKLFRMKPRDFTKVLKCNNGNKSMKEIPGPTPLPIMGSSWIYSPFGPYSKDVALTTAREGLLLKYGSIYKEVLSGKHIVSIHSPEDFHTLLRNQGMHPMRTVNEATIQFRRSRPDLYNSIGLVDTNNEEWYDIRMKVAPALLKGGMLYGFTEIYSGIADEFVKIVKYEGKDDIDVRPILYRFGLEVIFWSTLGHKLGALEVHTSNQVNDLIVLSRDLFDLFGTLNMSRPWYKLWRTPAYRKYCRCEEELFRIISVYTRNIMKHVERGLHFTSEAATPLIFHFLANKDFDEKDITTNVIDLIASGISTTTFFLSLLLHRIGQEQEIQNRIFKEMDSHNLKRNSVISDHTLRNLPYLEAVLKEGYRLTTIISGIFRILRQPIAIGEYLIPAFTPIIAQSRAASLSETYFSSPLEFIPDRWLKQKSSNPEIAKFQDEVIKNRSLVMPFGYGARMCVGRKLAEREMYVLLAKIFLNFRIESEGTLEMENRFLIGPKSSVRIKFHER